MRKTFKSFLLIGLVVLSGLLLVACGEKGDSKAMKAAKEELTIVKILKDNTSKDEVKTDLDLVTNAGEATITWNTDKPAVVSVAGKVTRTVNDEQVKLTANLKVGSETSTKEFAIKVLKVENGTDPTPTPSPEPNPEPNPTDENVIYEFNFENENLGNSYSTNSNKSFTFTNLKDNEKVSTILNRTALSSSHSSIKDYLVISGAHKEGAAEGSIEFNVTKEVKSLSFKFAYWSDFDAKQTKSVIIQTKVNGVWTDYKDITSETTGALAAKEIVVSGLTTTTIRILVKGEPSQITGQGKNGARVLVGELRFFKG